MNTLTIQPLTPLPTGYSYAEGEASIDDAVKVLQAGRWVEIYVNPAYNGTAETPLVGFVFKHGQYLGHGLGHKLTESLESEARKQIGQPTNLQVWRDILSRALKVKHRARKRFTTTLWGAAFCGSLEPNVLRSPFKKDVKEAITMKSNSKSYRQAVARGWKTVRVRQTLTMVKDD